MADFVKVATLDELFPGTVKTVHVSGTPVALYNVDGKVHATANACPHRGGSLGEGSLDKAVVSCPWHGFQFEVTSGKCLTNPTLTVSCYPVRIEGQDILVQL